MSGIGKRLLSSTADLAAAVEARTNAMGDSVQGRSGAPRTAPGQMLAARGEMLSMQAQIAQLRARLEQFDQSLPTLKLDPRTIRHTRWLNRHERSFASPSFARLKASIEQAGGNTQPILVRKAEDDEGYEVVFGHRRHRACLELGLLVLAVQWSGPMPDQELFLAMDRENREREDPSAYEQGSSYQSALEAGLFPSQRRLAEALGVSHTWVQRAIRVAELPAAIVEVFASPTEIQPRHAEEIGAAMDLDRKAVLRRAERLRRSDVPLSANKAVAELVGRPQRATAAVKIRCGDRPVGSWRRDDKGRAVITLDARAADDATVREVIEAIAARLSEAVDNDSAQPAGNQVASEG